jgi:hypothetical protein
MHESDVIQIPNHQYARSSPTTHHSTLINTCDTFPNDRLITSNDAQTSISMPRSPWYTIDPGLPTLPATATSTSSRNRPKIDDEAAAAQPFYFFSSIPLLPLSVVLSPLLSIPLYFPNTPYHVCPTTQTKDKRQHARGFEGQSSPPTALASNCPTLSPQGSKTNARNK